ncbi:MAG: two component, sigma54 specific, Fis family transcriptional regulator [uncultured bacterium]|nr:MAG: two component, sigma54 specific, Fis family transcriptional regulator [uncultured bacterium]
MLHDYKSLNVWQKNNGLGLENHILVVEDDPCLVKFWKRILEDMPEYSSTIFNNPFAALHWLKTNSPDLLVTDLSMPGMDGTSLIRCVLQKNPDTKVILTTGFVPEQNDFDQLGARIHLVPKPYTNMTHVPSLIKLLFSEDADLEETTEKISVWNI